MNQNVEILKQKGLEVFNAQLEPAKFTSNPEANKFLNNIVETPHGFMLGCLMDRVIKTERAWMIPYRVGLEAGGFAFSDFARLNLEELYEIFERQGFHRFNRDMAEIFFKGVVRIQEDYSGDAARIWNDNPSSARLIRRFLAFDGVGIKIATMATNILMRQFKIPLADKQHIEVSPDVHIRRVFTRLGFITPNASIDEIVYAARELNPEYPGVFDAGTWEIGKHWCKSEKPLCDLCYLNEHCPKIGI